MCFRPLQFCTGVVRKATTKLSGICFRPLQFCTGVVQEDEEDDDSSGFRPLQFCTGVVRIPNLPQKAEVLDPCIFARV